MMRSLAFTLSIGAVAAAALSFIVTGFVPGFVAGVGYMLAAAVVINSQRGA